MFQCTLSSSVASKTIYKITFSYSLSFRGYIVKPERVDTIFIIAGIAIFILILILLIILVICCRKDKEFTKKKKEG